MSGAVDDVGAGVTGPAGSAGPEPDPATGKVDGCELCEAARFTHWYAEDEHGWIADCEVCSVPMVVWHRHGSEPPAEVVAHLLGELTRVAAERYGPDGFAVDREMRQVPGHFHAHARPPTWWHDRSTRPPSRYTGVGGERVTR